MKKNTYTIALGVLTLAVLITSIFLTALQVTDLQKTQDNRSQAAIGAAATLAITPQQAQIPVGSSIPVKVTLSTVESFVSSIAFRVIVPKNNNELQPLNLRLNPTLAKSSQWSFPFYRIKDEGTQYAIEFSGINNTVTGLENVTDLELLTFDLKANSLTPAPVTISFDTTVSKVMTKNTVQNILTQTENGIFTAMNLPTPTPIPPTPTSVANPSPTPITPHASTVIDDFETYNGSNTNLNAAYRRNSAGNVVTLALTPNFYHQGQYGLQFDYLIDNPNYAGVTKTNLNHANWTGANSIIFWLKPDNSNHRLTIQFTEGSTETWEAYYTLSGTNSRLVVLPLSQFVRPTWQSATVGNNQIDLGDIVSFSIYVNQGTNGSTAGISTIYLDDIRADSAVVTPTWAQATPTPISSISPTPGVTIARKNVTFKFRLQGITDPRSNPPVVTIELKQNGNSVFTDTIRPSVGAQGVFTITPNLSAIPGGTYDVYIKSPSHLNKKHPGVSIAQAETSPFQTIDLTNSESMVGDVNSTNTITLEDVASILKLYTTFVVPVAADTPEDVNADQTVTINDVALGILNYEDFTIRGDN